MVDYVPIDMQIAIVCVFVQAALTFYAVFRMGVVRIRSIRQHNIRLSDIALDSRAYPAEALKQRRLHDAADVRRQLHHSVHGIIYNFRPRHAAEALRCHGQHAWERTGGAE